MSNDDIDSLDADKRIDRVCDAFERSWLDRKKADIQPVLADVPEQYRSKLLLQLIGIDVEYRKRYGVPLGAKEYIIRFPELTLVNVEILFDSKEAMRNEASITSGPKTARPGDTDAFPQIELNSNPVPKTIHYFGDYELLEKVARGGMGTVYRARQISLNRIVAIKMINSVQFASNAEIRRFYSEAEAAASLDHPNIVPVYEVGEFEGDHFFSMAYVEGSNLSELLSQSLMKPENAAKLLRLVSHAVQYAHAKGKASKASKGAIQPLSFYNFRDDQNLRSDFPSFKRLGPRSFT